MTILGWGVTASYQWRLFQQQTKAEIEKEKRELFQIRLLRIENYLGHLGTVINHIGAMCLILHEVLKEEDDVDDLKKIYDSNIGQINNILRENVIPQTAGITTIIHMMDNKLLLDYFQQITKQTTFLLQKIKKRDGTIQDLLNEQNALKNLEINIAKELQIIIDDNLES